MDNLTRMAGRPCTASVFPCAPFVLAAVIASGALAQVTEIRTLDGRGNNPIVPEAGCAGHALHRMAPAAYGDGMGAVVENRPNARLVSNLVHDQVSSRPDSRGVSEMIWLWGQFVDHDMDHTLLGAPTDRADVVIPAADPVFTPGQALVMTRSGFALDAAGVRQQSTNISAFLDAGMVYGGRASEGDGMMRANFLRSFSGGRLRTSAENGEEYMPRRGDSSAPAMAGPVPDPTILFCSGDVRANENPGLCALHTLFVREHNAVADAIAARRPDLGDEDLYQAARKVVGAEIQAITYNEFLPAMGVALPAYRGYSSAVDPSIANEFSTAAYRAPHSQINGVTLCLNPDGSTHALGHIPLEAGFFNPNRMVAAGVGTVLRGICSQVQEDLDAQVQPGLRNMLFGPPTAGPIANGSDVVALDIQRGRDHGIADYNTVRAAYGLAPVAGFGELTGDRALAKTLASVYGDISSLDLWTALVCEEHLPGASIGMLGSAIWADQFSRVRDGDRFFYLADPDFAPGGFLDSVGFGADEIDLRRLGEILDDRAGVTAVGIEGNVFFVGSPVTHCDADINGDSAVDALDLAVLLGDWGGAGSSADLDADGIVLASDLAILLNHWGSCP